MKKRMVWILFMLCFGINSYAQAAKTTDSLDRDKISRDSVFIHKLTAIYNHHPTDILPLFDNCNRQPNDLGFGYYSVEGFYGLDSTSNLIIGYQFIFRHEKLIAYQLSTNLPIRQNLLDIYKQLYNGLFNFNINARIGDKCAPVYYNYSEMTKPLKGSKMTKATNIDEQIRFLMTPFSGTMYGGMIMGYVRGELPNRTHYEAVKNKITPQTDYMLLYSLNPATRLSAIEYYYQHPELFKEKAVFEARIKAIYKETPIVTTIIGSNHTSQPAEELVRIYANKH